ncbi:MAG: nitrilase-related carbon-nitrogen hydrolase [bacterium]
MTTGGEPSAPEQDDGQGRMMAPMAEERRSDVRVGVVQHDIVWQDAAATRARLEPVLAVAAGTARLLVLTEMFATGFSMRPQQVAEPRGGPTERWLTEQAARLDVWLIGSVAQLDDAAGTPDSGRSHGATTHATARTTARAVNVAVVAGPGGELYRYEKMHPFSFGGEHEHYRPGDKPLTVDIDGVRTSVFVCYDLRFGADFWPLAADTDLYVVVANWPQSRREHWRTLLRARAIENQAYVVGANRVGPAGADGDPPAVRLDHCGDSTVIDPFGQVLVEAAYAETVLQADVDPAVVADVRARFPFLADRR